MSKKRDALRRGIRALIDDTSRELAAFEGREAASHAPSVTDPAPSGAERPAPDGAVAREEQAGGGEAPPDAGRPVSPLHRSEPAALNGRPIAAEPHAPPASPPAPPRLAEESPPVQGGRGATPAAKPDAPAARRDASTGRRGKAKAIRPPAGERTPRGRRSPGDAARPRPAETRSGVCSSYFVNHECWRVPNAYCNTALQVCVIRNCPVYHLHKDALERRFAKKFTHFW